jgi:hypothetical protein
LRLLWGWQLLYSDDEGSDDVDEIDDGVDVDTDRNVFDDDYDGDNEDNDDYDNCSEDNDGGDVWWYWWIW